MGLRASGQIDGFITYATLIIDRAIAQLAERARHMREATGSSPVGPTKNQKLSVIISPLMSLDTSNLR